MIAAVGKVVGELLLGRVRVRNIGHEHGASDHQDDEDDAAQRAQRSNCLAMVTPSSGEAATKPSVLQVEGQLDLGLGRRRDVARGHLSPGAVILA